MTAPLPSKILTVLISTSLLVLPALSASGAPDPEVQQEAFDQLAAKMHHATHITDEAGNLIYVELKNHRMNNKRIGERPGLDAEDMRLFDQFPKLRGLYLEHPGAPAESYAVFADKPLQYVNVKDPEWADREVGGEYLLHFDNCRDLRELNLYHNFGQQAPWSRMQGFPELRRFAGERELSSGQAIIDLLEHSPKLEFLDLQRAVLSDEEIRTLFAMLPEVRVVKWKPSGPFRAEQLKYLELLPKLEYVILEFRGALPLPYENGLEYLADIDTLETLRLHFSEEEIASRVEWKPLAERRPELLLITKRSVLAPASLATDDRQIARKHLPDYPAYVDFFLPTGSSTNPVLKTKPHR